MTRTPDAPTLLSREELEEAFGAFATAAPRIHHLRAVRAHIAALEAERDAALIALQSWKDNETPEVGRIEQAAYARGLEDAAKLADEEERVCEELRSERPHESYHWSFWERARKSASTIAAAIRALRPAQVESVDG